jgi:hypothetical protein
VNVPLSTPKQRIIAALAISLIVHAIFLWIPNIELPASTPELPPLMAKLEPVSRQARLPAAKKPRSKPPAATPLEQLPVVKQTDVKEISAESSVATTSSMAETDSLAALATEALDAESTVIAASSVAESTSATPPRPPLPKHARLRFEVKLGSDGMVVGETIHTLEFDDGQYKLDSTTQTIGLARMVKSFTLKQSSWGMSDGQLLFPRKFTEDKTDENGTRSYQATFDREKNKLVFADGQEIDMPTDAQDMLSILYQFPPLPADGDVLPISVTNGHNLDKYRFEVTTDEALITRMGKLHTVHFRKLQPAGKEGLEIWFSQEHRLLPVKVRHIEPGGKIGGEAIITEIRLSDN